MYAVTLHFAEIYFDSPGQRVFDVQIEGVDEISGLDVFDVAGHDVAYAATHYITVADGHLTIRLVPDVSEPALKAITVRSIPPTPTSTPTSTSTPTPPPTDYHISRWNIAVAAGGTMTSTTFIARLSAGQLSTDLSAADQRYSVGGIWTPHEIDPWYVPVQPTPAPPAIPTIGLPTQTPPTPQPTPQAGDVEPFNLLRSAEGGEYFPETLNLPGCPDLEPPDFPSSLNLPTWPELATPSFTTTLGLPEMPTLTLMSYITDVFSPIISLTESIVQWDTVISSSLFLPAGIADATGIGIDGYGEGGSAAMDIELAGYTPDELAGELVGGLDAALSYIRGVESIGVDARRHLLDFVCRIRAAPDPCDDSTYSLDF
jgi:hypothetical protein